MDPEEVGKRIEDLKARRLPAADMDEQMQALRELMELLASFHRDMEVKFDAHQAQMARLITRLTAAVVDHEDRIRRIEESF